MMFFAARRIAWSNLVPWDKDVREEKMWPLPELDDKVKRERIKKMPRMKVTIDGKEQR